MNHEGQRIFLCMIQKGFRNRAEKQLKKVTVKMRFEIVEDGVRLWWIQGHFPGIPSRVVGRRSTQTHRIFLFYFVIVVIVNPSYRWRCSRWIFYGDPTIIWKIFVYFNIWKFCRKTLLQPSPTRVLILEAFNLTYSYHQSTAPCRSVSVWTSADGFEKIWSENGFENILITENTRIFVVEMHFMFELD